MDCLLPAPHMRHAIEGNVSGSVGFHINTSPRALRCTREKGWPRRATSFLQGIITQHRDFTFRATVPPGHPVGTLTLTTSPDRARERESFRLTLPLSSLVVNRPRRPQVSLFPPPPQPVAVTAHKNKRPRQHSPAGPLSSRPPQSFPNVRVAPQEGLGKPPVW